MNKIMNKHSFIIVLCLLALQTAPGAQTITQQKGLTTAVFTTSGGTIKVYLPDDIRTGDVISGRVVAEPEGKNEKQLQRNMAELVKYAIGLNGEKFTVEQGVKAIRFTVAPDRPMQGSMELWNAKGTSPVQQVTIPKKPVGEQKPASAQCMIPSHALTGSSLNITGPFDGNSFNTNFTLDNKPVEIIAESPRQSIISYPADAGGLRTLKVQENGKPTCSNPVSGIEMKVSAGKLDLQRGDRTFIDVNIFHLQHLPDTALLTLTNISTNVITMPEGNNIIVPIPPPSDSMNGTYTRRFNVQSIQTGSFAVNVNLHLPEAGSTAPSELAEVKPVTTTTARKCDCNCIAKIERSGTRGSRSEYKANVNGGCGGFCGTGTTIPVCPPGVITYQWSISGEKGAATISGSSQNQNVSVIEKNKDARYSVDLTVIINCLCEVSCRSSDALLHPGKNPDLYPPDSLTKRPGKDLYPPGKITDPPDSLPPIWTPISGPVVECLCKCSIDGVTITRKDLILTANAMGAACKIPPNCPDGAKQPKCSIKSITYDWSVTSGKDVMDIAVSPNGLSATLKKKSHGIYVITVTATVTCLDGSSCLVSASYSDFTPASCKLTQEEKVEPMMDGRLKPNCAGTKVIHRDDYIYLGAEAADFDQLKWTCEPTTKDCGEKHSDTTIALNGRVRFEWSIAEKDKGSFVKLGCLPVDQLSAVGDNVIFKPPFVLLPATGEKSVTTTIKLSIIDDNPTQPIDPPKEYLISIVTKRSAYKLDFYTVEITGRGKAPPLSPKPTGNVGNCKASGPVWEKKNDLTIPSITLPGVQDYDKMVIGQWIVLEANPQRDTDKLTITCEKTGDCSTGPWSKDYEDNVIWDWTLVSGGGRFVSDLKGRFVIYEAPMELELPQGKDFAEITIKVKVSNPGGPGGKLNDDKPVEGEIKLKVYQPGIKLSNPPLAWLPEDTNFVELESQLMYKEGDWKPALAHMCRIHFFELMEVSHEIGVCMNDPATNLAKEWRDLQLKEEEGQESFDGEQRIKSDLKKDLFQQARTQRPGKEYNIKVYSNDFASFGFLRSFANINAGGARGANNEKPYYTVIPVLKKDVTHPLGREKIKEYKDNRVTIPHDIDENHFCDNGWIAMGDKKMNDPEHNPKYNMDSTDKDDIPTGDGSPGDGLTVYEEYRGFKTWDNREIKHVRTNYTIKDIFIHNVNNLPIELYKKISGLNVYEINGDQYCHDKHEEEEKSRERTINFNFTFVDVSKEKGRQPIHIDQKGLVLNDMKKSNGILGVATSVFCAEGKPTCKLFREAPPNWIRDVRIYSDNIAAECIEKGPKDKPLDYPGKLAITVAHELLHANNVYHHGEPRPGAVNPDDYPDGRRSGNMNCVMRYDNIGTPIDDKCKKVEREKIIPEAYGDILCDSPAATGNKCFGNAAPMLGDCIHQIRVSGRGGLPARYGNREKPKSK